MTDISHVSCGRSIADILLAAFVSWLVQGFAERKVLLLGSVLAAVKAIHTAAAKQERVRLHSACRQVRGSRGCW
jgi:hypothetical protein